MGKEATRVRRRERKNIASGVAHVNATFNNTMITITDAQGNTIAWSSAGNDGIQGLAQVDALCRSGRRRRCRQEGGRSTACARSKSRSPVPAPGRELALRALQSAGFTITSIRDVTTIPHNGCRPRKRRRV